MDAEKLGEAAHCCHVTKSRSPSPTRAQAAALGLWVGWGEAFWNHRIFGIPAPSQLPASLRLILCCEKLDMCCVRATISMLAAFIAPTT